MSAHKWRSGPPPHVGWWESSTQDSHYGLWRWWDGKRWSLAAGEHRSAEFAAERARTAAVTISELRYTTYWPENARVPRIDPNAAARHVRDQVLANVEIRTADGVAVAPGDRVWVNGSVGIDRSTVQPVVPVTNYFYGSRLIPVSQSYSTEEAARAARYKR